MSTTPGECVEAVPGPAVLAADLLEPERGRHERGGLGLVPLPDLRAVESADLPFDGDRTAVPWRERPGVRMRALGQRHAHAVHVDQRQHPVAEPGLDCARGDAVCLEPGAPPVEAAGRHLEADLHRQTVAEPRRRHVGPREERQVRPGVAFGVRVEEVIGAGIVLVDAALDEAHPEDAGVEVEVFLGGPGYRRDVVQPFDSIHTTTIAG